MASKQPLKFINITQRLTTWSIRINKFFKHRLLSKRKNVLIITEDNFDNLKALKAFSIIDSNSNSVTNVKNLPIAQSDKPAEQRADFQQILFKTLKKTWQIKTIKSANIPRTKLLQQSLISKPQQKNQIEKSKQIDPSSQQQPSSIVLSKYNSKEQTNAIEKYFVQKKKYFDAVIVLPEKSLNSIGKQSKEVYPEIQDQAFATDFIQTFQEKIMKNITAYRYAHKFLNTSGAFIISTGQYDFLKKSDEEKQKQQKKKLEDKKQDKDKFVNFSKERPPASKQIIDSTLCYLGVVVGDRDYTDLNSWTLVSLSEQASKQIPQFVAKMYYDWADGQQLPMPGSFTLFKRKILENQKYLNFVQYL